MRYRALVSLVAVVLALAGCTRSESDSGPAAGGGNESVLFQGKAPKILQHALRELIGT